MNWVLDSEVRHPSKLIKGRQVLKHGLDKIYNLNSVDVSDLAFRKRVLISGPLLKGAEIGFNGGRGPMLAVVSDVTCVVARMRASWLGMIHPISNTRISSVWVRKGPQRHW